MINGASFNYATKNDDIHTKFDVDYGESDPAFRKEIKGYKAPKPEQHKNPEFYNGEQSLKEASDEYKEKFNKKVSD